MRSDNSLSLLTQKWKLECCFSGSLFKINSVMPTDAEAVHSDGGARFGREENRVKCNELSKGRRERKISSKTSTHSESRKDPWLNQKVARALSQPPFYIYSRSTSEDLNSVLDSLPSSWLVLTL